MKVSWELPTENRECVHHYRICYEPLNLFNLGGRNIPERCIETQNTSIVITDLEPCATYRIKVNAVTALGSYSIDTIEEAFTEFESMYPLHFRVFVQRRLDPGKETLEGFFQVGHQKEYQNVVIISFVHLEKINIFCFMHKGVAQKLSLPRPLEN